MKTEAATSMGSSLKRLLGVALATGALLGASHAWAADYTVLGTKQFSALDGGPNDEDGLTNGIFEVTGDLTIAAGGSIENNDPTVWPNLDKSAGAIELKVGGNLEMLATSSIFAENRFGAGNGGSITIHIAEDLLMHPDSTISSSRVLGSNLGFGVAGKITIILSGNAVIPEDAKILANNVNKSGAGAIEILANGPQSTIDMDGLIESAVLSGLTGTGAKQGTDGGQITLIASCALNISDTGVVSSRGKDAAADLVHLQACDVSIFGLIESTGPGHAVPNNPYNHLNKNAPVSTATPTPRCDKPDKSTAGIEIWAGDTLLLDGLNHKGQINADIGGIGGTRSWIDMFAGGDINIIANTNAGMWAVHANGNLAGNTAQAGIITVKSKQGNLTASGLALQADSTSAGSKGGNITLEANLAVTLDTASVFARGDANQSGGYGFGGKVDVRSFNGAAGLSWATGTGNVMPTGTDTNGTVLPPANRGVINLTACTVVDVTGTVFPDVGGGPATTPTISSGILCGGTPPLPLENGGACPPYVILTCEGCEEPGCVSALCVFDAMVVVDANGQRQLQLNGVELSNLNCVRLFLVGSSTPVDNVNCNDGDCGFEVIDGATVEIAPPDAAGNVVLTSLVGLNCAPGNYVVGIIHGGNFLTITPLVVTIP